MTYTGRWDRTEIVIHPAAMLGGGAGRLCLLAQPRAAGGSVHIGGRQGREWRGRAAPVPSVHPPTNGTAIKGAKHVDERTRQHHGQAPIRDGVTVAYEVEVQEDDSLLTVAEWDWSAILLDACGTIEFSGQVDCGAAGAWNVYRVKHQDCQVRTYAIQVR